MSSGVAMNRKIQREGGNSSMANLATKNGRSVNENMTQSGAHPRVALRQQNKTQQNKTQQKGPAMKHLKGTPAQKNWYLLSVHEQRLNRLEAWAQIMMSGNGPPNSNDADTAVHQQQEPPKQAPALSRGNTQKIQRSKVVTLEVNETNT